MREIGIPSLTAVLVFLLLMSVGKYYQPEKIVLKTYKEISGFLRRQRTAADWYQRTEQWLLKNGAAYHYGNRIEPMGYLAVRIVVMALGAAALLPVSGVCGFFAAILLFYLPNGMLVYLNRRDNERMLPELKLVYHALEIQLRAGVYVTDALTECYGSVQNLRLQKALLDLAGDIVMKADIYDAMERFQGSFDNRYIDSLCIIILQALESGQALELLGDIGEQIKDMEQTVLVRKKGALDRSVTFYQLGILAIILGVSLYACVTHMMGEAVRF